MKQLSAFDVVDLTGETVFDVRVPTVSGFVDARPQNVTVVFAPRYQRVSFAQGLDGVIFEHHRGLEQQRTGGRFFGVVGPPHQAQDALVVVGGGTND